MKLLTIKEVAAMTRLSRSSIYRYVDIGEFPKPVKLGDSKGSRIVWVEQEILDWIKSQLDKRAA